MDALILQQALAAATICKVLVDLVRQSTKIEGWKAPLLALVFGITSSLLLVLAQEDLLNAKIISQSIIAGILAAGSAVGVTELQKRVQ